MTGPMAKAAASLEAASDAAEQEELTRRLAAMHSELQLLQDRRAELQALLDQAGTAAEAVQDEEDRAKEEIASCASDLLEILTSSGEELDSEDQESLRVVAEALLAEPALRADLPLPMLLLRMPLALLPPDEAGAEPAYRLAPEELAALLANQVQVPLWLCERLLASAQGRMLGPPEALAAAAQRPELLPRLLASGRVAVAAGSLDEEHLVVLAESSPEARQAVLAEPRCLMGLSDGALRQLTVSAA
eukprot:CAMPEP_0175223326 /NCGR_PEP_ID=MMETSP0093-20121207/21277_1 /TAXON_ID=311494 /ORGANISM="Alexandrium monilatum, Strain CCMP3105" /LENGTH=246 /DNA_ID=CAMNT_0016516931 /DNA_START=26 /DNA_END=766 /DNA_ORIENTATION=+